MQQHLVPTTGPEAPAPANPLAGTGLRLDDADDARAAATLEAATLEARTPSTRRSYATAWTAFTGWCEARGECPLPTTGPVLAGYLAARAAGTDDAKPVGIASLRMAIAAVNARHDEAGLAKPGAHKRVREALAAATPLERAREHVNALAG